MIEVINVILSTFFTHLLTTYQSFATSRGFQPIHSLTVLPFLFLFILFLFFSSKKRKLCSVIIFIPILIYKFSFILSFPYNLPFGLKKKMYSYLKQFVLQNSPYTLINYMRTCRFNTEDYATWTLIQHKFY